MTLEEFRKSLGIEHTDIRPLLDQAIFTASHEAFVRRNTIKQRAVDFHGGKCANCGYNRCLRALEFHHVRPQSKSFNVSEAMWESQAGEESKSWAKVKKEISKCVLLCANCHREVEAMQSYQALKWIRDQTDIPLDAPPPVKSRETEQ